MKSQTLYMVNACFNHRRSFFQQLPSLLCLNSAAVIVSTSLCSVAICSSLDLSIFMIRILYALLFGFCFVFWFLPYWWTKSADIQCVDYKQMCKPVFGIKLQLLDCFLAYKHGCVEPQYPTYKLLSFLFAQLVLHTWTQSPPEQPLWILKTGLVKFL